MPRSSVKKRVTDVAGLALAPADAKRPRRLWTPPSENDAHQGFSPMLCLSWFHAYSSGTDVIGPDGVERLCRELDVEPSDVLVLVLAWLMGAKRMGYFAWQEWLAGMHKLRADSIDVLRLSLPQLRRFLDEEATLREIYRYAFDYARDPDQRSVDVPTAAAMLLLVPGARSPHTGRFVDFITRHQPRLRAVNRDQWANFIDFCLQIKPDYSNYDELSAWPVLLDDFVTWCRQQLHTPPALTPSHSDSAMAV